MFEFQGKLRKMFNKKQDIPPEKQALQPMSSHPEEAPPDIESLTRQLREFEQRIKTERAAWSEKLKIRDEERITTEAQLEQLENSAAIEHKKRDIDYQHARENALDELSRLKTHLSKLREQWEQSSREKDQAHEHLEHELLLEDTHAKVTHETKARTFHDELSALTVRVRQIEEEAESGRMQWMESVKKKDEHIIALRTKLSLREAQLQEQWAERDRQEKKVQEEWENQIDDFQQKILEQKNRYERHVAAADAAMQCLQEQLEHKQKNNAQIMQETESAYQKEFARLQEKIALLQKQSLNEKETWDRMLRSREEEFNKLKADHMISEAQEKADWEKRKEEMAQYGRHCERRLKSLQRSYDEEKELCSREIQKKNEEIDSLKIHVSLLDASVKQKQENLIQEFSRQREKLEQELLNTEQQINQEREEWQRELHKRDEALAAVRADMQKRREEEHAIREKTILALLSQKAALEKDLSVVQESMRRDKNLFAAEIERKEQEAVHERLELKRKQERIDQELSKLEQSMRVVQAPLEEKVRALEAQGAQQRDENASKIEEKERLIAACKKEMLRLEEAGRQKTDEQAARIEREKQDLYRRIDTCRTERVSAEKKYNADQESKDEEVRQLRKQKQNLTDEYQSRREELLRSLRADRQNLESQIPELEKNRDEQQRVHAQESAQKQVEIDRLQEAIAGKNKETDTTLALLSQQWHEVQEKQQQQLREEEEMVRQCHEEHKKTLLELTRHFNDLIYENENLKRQHEQELDAFRIAQEEDIKPLLVQKEELRHALQTEQEQWDAHQSEAHHRITQLQESLRELEVKKEEEERKSQAYYQRAEEEMQRAITQRKESFEREKREINEERERREKHITDIQHDINRRLKDHEQHSTSMREEAAQALMRLQEEKEALERTLGSKREQWPGVLQALDGEISKLQQKVTDGEQLFLMREQEHTAAIEEFRRKKAHEIEALQKQIEEAEHAHDELIKVKNAEIDAITARADETAGEIEHAVAQEGKLFAEEKFKIQKKIDDIEWKLKDHEDVTSKQIETKNKEITQLKTVLEEKDTSWQKRSQSLQEQYDRAKKELAQNTGQLDERLKKMNEESMIILLQREQEAQAVRQTHDHAIKQLKNELDNKKKAWKETIIQLKQQRDDLSKYWDDRNIQWERIVREKDAERSRLRQQLMEWETVFLKQEQDMSGGFKEKIESLKKELARKEELYAAEAEEHKKKLTEQDTMITSLRQKEEQLEREVVAEIEKRGQEFIKEETQLKEKIDYMHGLINDTLQDRGKEQKQLDQELSELTLELSTRRARLNLDLQKRTGEHEKFMHELNIQLNEFERKHERDHHDLQLRMRLKDEEIAVLQQRLAMRSQRLNNEWEHRAAALNSVKERLEIELSELEQSYEGSGEKNDEIHRQQRAAIDEVSAELKCFPHIREQAMQGQRHAMDAEKQKIIDEINCKDNEIKDSETAVQDALRKKTVESELLMDEIQRYDCRINHEVNISQHILNKAMEKALTVKNSFKNAFGIDRGSHDAAEKAMASMTAGINYYQSGQYQNALVEFARAIEYKPEMWTAFQYQGLCYERLTLTVEALIAAEKALALQPKNTDLKEWIKQLKEMQ